MKLLVRRYNPGRPTMRVANVVAVAASSPKQPNVYTCDTAEDEPDSKVETCYHGHSNSVANVAAAAAKIVERLPQPAVCSPEQPNVYTCDTEEVEPDTKVDADVKVTCTILFSDSINL
jgi:hypothetical protein